LISVTGYRLNQRTTELRSALQLKASGCVAFAVLPSPGCGLNILQYCLNPQSKKPTVFDSNTNKSSASGLPEQLGKELKTTASIAVQFCR
jgi:hypothetical protein